MKPDRSSVVYLALAALALAVGSPGQQGLAVVVVVVVATRLLARWHLVHGAARPRGGSDVAAVEAVRGAAWSAAPGVSRTPRSP